MKIIFEAFSRKLWSRPMEYPDNMSSEFYLPMPMDVLVYDNKRDMSVPSVPITKRAKFRRTGGSYVGKDLGLTGDEEYAPVYIYTLVDIS